jgi:hypothetical protein
MPPVCPPNYIDYVTVHIGAGRVELVSGFDGAMMLPLLGGMLKSINQSNILKISDRMTIRC